MNIKSKSQNNVTEPGADNSLHNVPEESSSNNEISELKNIFKIPTPLPLEPSLYSPIHHS